MQLIADIFLAAGALCAAFYCFVLGRRLTKFNNLEKGVGGAVAVLSTQVEGLKQTLESAQSTAAASAETLTDLNVRAEEISKRLELQIAACNDLPEAKPAEQKSAENVDEIAPGEDEKTVPAESGKVAGPALVAEIAESEPMFIRHAGGAR